MKVLHPSIHPSIIHLWIRSRLNKVEGREGAGSGGWRAAWKRSGLDGGRLWWWERVRSSDEDGALEEVVFLDFFGEGGILSDRALSAVEYSYKTYHSVLWLLHIWIFKYVCISVPCLAKTPWSPCLMNGAHPSECESSVIFKGGEKLIANSWDKH